MPTTERNLKVKLQNLQQTVPDLDDTKVYVLAEALAEMLDDADVEADPHAIVLQWFDLFERLVDPGTNNEIAKQAYQKMLGNSRKEIEACRPALLDIMKMIEEKALARDVKYFYRRRLYKH